MPVLREVYELNTVLPMEMNPLQFALNVVYVTPLKQNVKPIGNAENEASSLLAGAPIVVPPVTGV